MLLYGVTLGLKMYAKNSNKNMVIDLLKKLDYQFQHIFQCLKLFG